MPLVRNQLTVTPLFALPNRSVTLTTSGFRSCRFAVSVCALPDTATIAVAGPAVAVAVTLVLNAPVVAVMVYAAGVCPRVTTVCARPVALVVALAGDALPTPDTVKFTNWFGTGALVADLTSTTNACGNVVPTSAIWSPPLIPTMLAGGWNNVIAAVPEMPLSVVALTTSGPPLVVGWSTPVEAPMVPTVASLVDHVKSAPAISVQDGESNWFEGVQLLAVYLMIAIAAFFV